MLPTCSQFLQTLTQHALIPAAASQHPKSHPLAVQVGEPTRDAPHHICAVPIPTQATLLPVSPLSVGDIIVYGHSKVTAIHVLH